MSEKNIKKVMRCVVSSVCAGILIVSVAVAADESQKYGGDLRSRSTLFGDWRGVRSDLADKGIAFDMSLTQVEQGITNGGKETGWDYGGRGDIVTNADTQKLGLWPGGLFTVEVEANFGQNVNNRTGAMMEVNSNQNYPTAESGTLALPQVMFTQFFSNNAGIVIGKMGTAQDANEFASGKGDSQFFNVALTFNPAAFLTIPYSTLGAGLIIAPTGDRKASTVKFFVLDSNGKANTTGFDTVFHGNTTYTGEGRVQTDFLDRTGHQLLGVSYSTNSFTSLDQNLRLVLEDRALQESKGSWCVYYNFDQYLYEQEKGSGKGIGVFGRFGASDGNPNPVHYFYSVGVGGKGIIPGRSLDSFGIGYYFISTGHPTFTGLFATGSFLQDEQGFEAYYNIGFTPWMKLTPDIQIVKPVQRLMVSGGTIRNVDTATVLGLRLQLIL